MWYNYYMKSYEKLLRGAPEHTSPEFIDYLRENNKVVEEDNTWIVIENFKYHTEKKPWLTAFWKGDNDGTCYSSDFAIPLADLACSILLYKYRDWEWLKKADSKQTVKRFHIHLIRK